MAHGGRPFSAARRRPRPKSLVWRGVAGGIAELGAASDDFAFDNERPRHRALLAYPRGRMRFLARRALHLTHAASRYVRGHLPALRGRPHE
jgi:hypothetical protein